MTQEEYDDHAEVIFLNPFTCGVYKDGGARYKIDPATGRRTGEIDNELGEHVSLYLAGREVPGMVSASLKDAFSKRVLVPRYYDARWGDEFRVLLAREDLDAVSLGDLVDRGIIRVRGGHGSPSNDQRSGGIPYIKVSDIRSLRVNVNPTKLVTEAVAKRMWRGNESKLRAWDLITPNRASSNIGEFAILLPGEEQVVITKEVFIIRVEGVDGDGIDPFYLLWAFCLQAVRAQWRRITLMQTNREDVGDRYREILIPAPRNAEWAEAVSAPFRHYFTAIAAARERFLPELAASPYEYIASARSTGGAMIEHETEGMEQ